MGAEDKSVPEELRRRGGFNEQGRQVRPQCGGLQMIKELQSTWASS